VRFWALGGGLTCGEIEGETVMKIAWIGRYAQVGLACLLASAAVARGADPQGKPKKEPRNATISPGDALAEVRDETLDRRHQALFDRLMKVCALLDAIDEKQFGNYGRQRKNDAAIKAADASIVRQHANGGGPIRWTQFYGRTIDEFYNPGPSRAVAVLDGWGNAAVGSSQGSPTLKQRPTQFDYIEKAQEKIKTDAKGEIGLAVKKMEDLAKRRKELEIERAKLLCEYQFRGVQRLDLTQKPLYRYEPVIKLAGTTATQRAESMREAVVLMSRVLGIVERAEEDQARAVHGIAVTVKGARVRMTDRWIQQGVLSVSVTNDRPDVYTPVGLFIALTMRLEECGKNLGDTYTRAIELSGSRAELSKLDEKAQNWELLDDSLFRFARVVVFMDQAAIQLAEQWQVVPDLEMPLMVEQVAASPLEAVLPSAPAPVPLVLPSSAFDLSRLQKIKIHEGKKWAEFPVSHDGGVARVDRGGGSKTPLKLEGNRLSWKNKGGKSQRNINLDLMRTLNGDRVELAFKN
jgi:hypothetical protein